MKRAATITTAILGLLACLNIFAGIHHLFTQTTTHIDLHLRWVDQQYILRGENPYDAFFADRSGDVQAYERRIGRDCRAFADLGQHALESLIVAGVLEQLDASPGAVIAL